MNKKKTIKEMSIEELKIAKEEAAANEEFGKAAEYRDEIENRKKE